MSDNLIPIAVSSELDITGEERIHSANLVPGGLVRTVWLGITGDLQDGAQGDSEAGTYTVIGGVSPYGNFSIISGSFPAGLTLAANGTWSGVRTTADTYSWTVSVTDDVGTTATLADSSETTSASIFIWNLHNQSSGQNAEAVYIDGDIVAMTGDNSLIHYSLNRGVTWNHVATPVGTLGSGIVKFNGDWYVFGHFGGATRCIKSVGDTFSSVSDISASIPFVPGQARGTTSYVIDSFLYVSANTTSPTTYKLHRCADPTSTWTTIDTGIAATGTNHNLTSHTESGGFHLFGTMDGKVLRTADFVTFSVVHTFATASEVQVAALGSVVLAANTDGIARSIDSGATFAAAYVQGTKVLANSLHFICSNGAWKVFTSPTGLSGSWTERLDAVSGTTVNGHGFATQTLAAFGSTSSGLSRAYVGDVV